MNRGLFRPNGKPVPVDRWGGEIEIALIGGSLDGCVTFVLPGSFEAGGERYSLCLDSKRRRAVYECVTDRPVIGWTLPPRPEEETS